MAKIVRFATTYIEPYPLQVQGESNYRANIEDVSGYTGEDEGVNADDFIAQLILDDSSEYDPGNAVRVEIEGKTVGHLAKPAAKKYRERLIRLGLFDTIGECYASIKGGFIKRSTGEQADFGVRLDLDLDHFEIPANTLYAAVPKKEEPPPGPAVIGNVPQTKSVPSAADIKTRRILIFTAASFVGCCIFMVALSLLAR